MKKVYVPRDPHEKALQRALMQYALPQNRKLVLEALAMAGRKDLIGYGPKCLVHPEGRIQKKTGAPGPKAGRRRKGQKR